MKKIKIRTNVSRGLADIFTPVGIYLRLRDRFRDTILLESTDSHASENSYSFIGINAIGGIEVHEDLSAEIKYPGREAEKKMLKAKNDLEKMLLNYMEVFETEPQGNEAALAQGLYGYFSFDAIPFFESVSFRKKGNGENGIPVLRYRLYQYIIAINHYKDELLILENNIEGIESEVAIVEALIRSKDVPVYPFHVTSPEHSGMDDAAFIENVKRGIQSCLRGDVFQVVLSRQYSQAFQGDDFNVYRALRYINPSPYLFYFDYGDYKLMGSSPESQLLIKNGKAVLNPIAGTFPRSHNEAEDLLQAEALQSNPKENAEHVMLVDLARNDLSKICTDVQVQAFREVRFYSHVIHLVSEVTGKVAADTNPFNILFQTFPAGTLSGAPKFRALQLIDELENEKRSFYGGAIGFVGFNGSVNHAIMIRSLLCRNNQLIYQAGAGIVAASDPDTERKEVGNKLAALKKAISMAGSIHSTLKTV